MDHLFGEIFKKGIRRDHIIDCFNKCVLTEHFMQSLALVRQRGCTVKILSDANTVFIETILAASSAAVYIDQIITNTAEFTTDGRLTVKPYHQTDPHACDKCPANLCKGLELTKFLNITYRRVIYIGDGSGDYCACTKLTPNDIILARHGYPLHQLLTLKKDTISAQVRSWANGSDVLKHFNEIYNEFEF